MENKARAQSHFCIKHDLKLDAEKFRYASDHLLQAAFILENEFNTGYIKLDQ